MIRAIIVDDEKPSVDIMKRLLSNSGKVEVKASFHNSNEALKFLKNNEIDVIFLDIQMPNINGLEFANILLCQSKSANSFKIVFITAYNQYAVEAFEVNALDYLLKPVKRDRLNKTIDRIANELEIKTASTKMKVKCFGKFEVYADNQRVKFRTKKAEELIALLIDNKGKSIARSKIIDCLWYDFDGDKALVNLNTTLYYVRKALQNHGLDITINFDRDSYSIEIDNIDCDYFEFDEYSTSEFKLQYEEISNFERLLDLYTDDYLIANDYEWTTARSLSLKEKYINLVLMMAEHYSNKGETPKAISILKDAYGKECINDLITYKLIELLMQEKKYTLAHKYYNYYENTLANLGLKLNNKFKKLIIDKQH